MIDSELLSRKIKSAVRSVPDHPKTGIMFRDVSPVLQDPELLRLIGVALAAPWTGRVDYVVGLEARGFIFGSIAALAAGCGFVMLRKPGKLPPPVDSWNYGLEYGKDCLELCRDILHPGDRVAIVDDVCATGGTAEAAIELVRNTGAEVVSANFLIDLPDLGGSSRLRALDVPVNSLVVY